MRGTRIELRWSERRREVSGLLSWLRLMMVESRNERDSEVITTEHCVNTDTLALSSVSGAVKTTTDADTLAIA